MNTTRVLALLPLFVVLAHSFTWDIVVGGEKRLDFYYNGTVTHTEDIPSANRITTVTYDPIHYRVLFADYVLRNMSISSFDLIKRKVQTLVTRQTSVLKYMNLAYDPVTELLFWTEFKEMYSISLKSASSNITVDGNVLVTAVSGFELISVDSCGGYIYWITEDAIERAAFDGSKRELLVDTEVFWRRGFAIDQQTETMYWIAETIYDHYSIESADLNGKNRRTFYDIGTGSYANDLTISKDFIYWSSHDQKTIMRLPKAQQHGVAPNVYLVTSTHCSWCQLTAANYTIEEQISGNISCKALKNLLLDEEERHALLCHNYCFQGNCSVSAEGHPKCKCNTGYSGDRCEVNRCRGYCLNNGDCSLNEGEEPVCRCSADYGGDRCEFPTVLIKCIQTVSMLREMLSADVTPMTLSKEISPTCASTVA